MEISEDYLNKILKCVEEIETELESMKLLPREPEDFSFNVNALGTAIGTVSHIAYLINTTIKHQNILKS
jgi:hypothetical protein